MYNKNLPVGETVMVKDAKSMPYDELLTLSEKYFIVVRCKVYVSPKIQYPPLPYRNNVHAEDNLQLLFPAGTFVGAFAFRESAFCSFVLFTKSCTKMILIFLKFMLFCCLNSVKICLRST